MKLNKKDRILLINQYKILSKLSLNETEYYEELIEILENGYEIFYSQIGDWVFDEMPMEEGILVLEILSVYRAIEDFKRQNFEEEIDSHLYSYFVGFDGNNETSYMSFARFLIHKQNKFSEQKQYLERNDDCNSHSKSKDKYTRMIYKWKEIGARYDLNKEEVLSILDA